MKVRFKENWEITGAKLNHKLYPLPANEQAIINEILDKLHEQGKLKWIQGLIPYAFPVFVAWRVIHKDGRAIRKGRAVINIRGLNKVTVFNAYFLPFQSDVIASMIGYLYFSLMDGTDFFY